MNLLYISSWLRIGGQGETAEMAETGYSHYIIGH
jgi:hypothetical protein